jgi:hypothetical protein
MLAKKSKDSSTVRSSIIASFYITIPNCGPIFGRPFESISLCINLTSPFVLFKLIVNILNSDDFPAPFGPRSPNFSPTLTAKLVLETDYNPFLYTFSTSFVLIIYIVFSSKTSFVNFSC